MNILVTGASGFIGKNLCANLLTDAPSKLGIQVDNVFRYDLDLNQDKFDEFCRKADFVFHLAGVNRPVDNKDFMPGNFGFTSLLLDTLKKYNNTCPVMISSSIQAALENPYGLSKKAGEDLMFKYSQETGARVLVYRFPNVFGKWCRPNYNSAVATFCNNIAKGLPITVNDPERVMNLVYIDDIVDEMFRALLGEENRTSDGFCAVPVTHEVKLGKIAELIESFKRTRDEISIPDTSDEFTKKLYATYLSHLDTDDFSYPLEMHCDDRGSFTEIIRTAGAGQFSVNISKPGITKGNHWHNTKNEKFVVVSGKGVIRFRKPDSDEVIEYFVSSEKIEVVDIPTGYTHSITNLGDTDMVTFMWCNECFDPEKPDTFFLEV